MHEASELNRVSNLENRSTGYPKKAEDMWSWWILGVVL